MSQLVELELLNSNAKKEDVTTIDGIIRALYDVISGPAGEPRQWERDRTLYAPGAVQVSSRLEDGKRITRVMDIDGYVQYADPRVLPTGFFEYETHRTTRRVGNITHVFSTYEGKHTPDGPVITRGINSIELVYANERYWIVAVLWDAASDNAEPVEV
jgi:hypothetical protein